MTEAAVRRDFLGSDSGLTTLVAEGAAIAGEAVRPLGYALHHVAYETAYAARGTCLIDLYVEEAVRRRGVGRALIAAVASETRARGGRFIWWVSKAWNVDAQQAYARLGAFSEPVVAHALFDEPFERLVDLTPSRGDGGA